MDLIDHLDRQLTERDESELLVDLRSGELTAVDPHNLIGVGPPSGTALLSALSKLELVAMLQQAASR